MYFEDFSRLKALFRLEEGRISVDERLDMAVIPFRSESPDMALCGGGGAASPEGAISPCLAMADNEVVENRRFLYPVMMPSGRKKATSAIILFHGLNEKTWEKYLPWAEQLCVRTGKAVVLFPIAFHMNRAPAPWSNPRQMFPAVAARERQFGHIESMSFANAALSTRLSCRPERFILSGLETCNDVEQLMAEIRSGRHPCIDARASIDFFGYSIGAFLAEVLMLSNPQGSFQDSRAFLFCGGTTLSGMTPVSKYIMDAKASATLNGFFRGPFEEELARESPLARLFEKIQYLGTIFRSLLEQDRMKGFRETQLRAIGGRISALALDKDRVIPGCEVERTLACDSPETHTRVRVLDFPFPYTHENPFPLLAKYREEVNASFEQVFQIACEFVG